MFFIKKKKKDEPIITLGISESVSPEKKEELANEEVEVVEEYEVVEEVEESLTNEPAEEVSEATEEKEETSEIKKRVLEKHAKFFKETLDEIPEEGVEVEETTETEEEIEEEYEIEEEIEEGISEEEFQEESVEESIFGEEVEEEEKTIQCPYCLRYIPANSTRCEFCGNVMTAHGISTEAEKSKLSHVSDNTEILQESKKPKITAETTIFLPAKLCLISPEDETVERIFTLSMGKTSIGRDPSNKLSFPDETFISRHHCTITYQKYQYVIKDLNSANGTYVNDVKIKETVLRDGDIIQIGALRFLFEDPMEQQKKRK